MNIQKGEVSLNELVEDLRSDLRKELKLPEVDQKLHWLTAASKDRKIKINLFSNSN